MTSPFVASEMLPPRLRSADPELPTLATRAAVELDGLRQGRAGELPSVKRLGELLRNSLTQPASECAGAGGAVACLMDPPTVVLVARALCQAGQKPGPTTREVCELTEAMAEKLEKAATLHDSSAGDELQQFCIELVRGVHRQPTFRRDPDLKPYRH